ncbi:hypothetical protein MSG28_014661 [Choristoneura fumiferana]|uniref:Uncharacterized protein n=1 Tax=Choristoneura fumiferana TaxID=7141 RepID=A0ACC0JS81_CHOFU|nr:hypothetical protein MSG28_014661 [Choristoneura fumiferana]
MCARRLAPVRTHTDNLRRIKFSLVKAALLLRCRRRRKRLQFYLKTSKRERSRAQWGGRLFQILDATYLKLPRMHLCVSIGRQDDINEYRETRSSRRLQRGQNKRVHLGIIRMGADRSMAPRPTSDL